MKRSIKKGIGFGLTSGIITTLGLMIGLYANTNSKIIILSGILLIAVADAFSDSLGIHISSEFANNSSRKGVWEATLSTFFSKFIFAITFVIPVLLLELRTAMIVSVIWGLLLISILSFYISKKSKYSSFRIILEHLALTIFVIIVTYSLGSFFRGFGA
jgi:VIT1/CCC1 family predicted Fe2+/Mn2+ transporter